GGHYGNALQAASAGGHDKIVQLLLDKGADVNAQGGYNGNALYAALAGGHDKIVQLLLDKGADVNAQGGEYGNALQAASAGGHDKTVQLLLDKGADVNAQGGHYGNALQAASAGGHDKIHLTTVVPLFLPYLIDDMVFKRDAVAKKAFLHLAADLGYRDLTNRCLYLGAEIEATDKSGETALHYTA
ncbi:hypothetical protein D6C98_10763, partial [Aureobasidium pullulans]